MRIPLDYYRILGVPIQASEKQIIQAYQDRRLQLPRREYSDLAITERQKLLDQAYNELSNPEKRAKYNAQFLKNYEIKTSEEKQEDTEEKENFNDGNPWLEIKEEQFLGALLILQELGEYELVLRLGDNYLVNENKPKEELTNEEKTIRNDIILTIALGCLELGREQWQQREYENAVASGKVGQELLLREGLFPSIQADIQGDLYKLRPYLILELLANEPDNLTKRRKGIRLLKEMLQERGGIEGLGDDKSGLSMEDFLRFIQQLRSYLTVTEQQELFEYEAKRPSPVATYLAVYALLAKGFADKKPELIVRAKKLLLILAKKQDVHLEQAICCLLLGQTEEAGEALELSQEFESVTFIKENSQGDNDLLHGLCLYTERWLQNEVFFHFQDLINRGVSLSEYFADFHVQDYLESLLGNQNPEPKPIQTPTNQVTLPPSYVPSQPEIIVKNPIIHTPENKLQPTTKKSLNLIQKLVLWLLAKIPSHSHKISAKHKQNSYRKKRRKTIKNNQKIPLFILPLFFIIIVFSLGYLLLKNNQKSPQVNNNPTNTTNDLEPLAISLNQPLIPLPSEETNSLMIDENSAKTIIQAWLDAKSQAFGKDYQIDSLDNILSDPLLSIQRQRANSIKNRQAYLEYEHQITIKNVKINEQKPEQAMIEAEVMENAKYYQGDQEIKNNSYNSNLLVSYNLIFKEKKWLITDLKIIR